MPISVRDALTPDETPLGEYRVTLAGPGAPERGALEAHVAEVYRAAYGAAVDHYLPLLLAIRMAGGALLGVIGARRAEHGTRLFLESYLDESVEAALSRRVGHPVPRTLVAEVGNLASVLPGGGRLLVAAMSAHLRSVGVEWAAFTGTTALRNCFRRLSVGLVEIVPADGARLGAEALAKWGTYYETRPRVVAARVADVCAAVADPLRLRHHLVRHGRRAS